MNRRKFGSLLVVILLVVTMTGCEIPFFHGNKSESKETTKMKEMKAKKEKEKLEAVKIEKEKLQQNKAILEKKIKDYIAANNVSGVIFVEQNHNILFNEGAGYADAEKKKVNKPSTTYPVGSITKLFVAT